MAFCDHVTIVNSIEDRFEVLSELGRGNFGVVSKVRDLHTHEIRAAKRIPKGAADKYIRREIETLRACANVVGVVRLHEVLETPVDICMIIDFVEHGDLMKFVVNRGGITELQACSIVHQLLRTVDAIHGKDVVHRDIKPHNILVEEVAGETLQIKLCDFGLAKKLPIDQRCMMTPAGDLEYSAPQIHDAIARGVLGVACYRDEATSYDVFSVGVTAYILLSGKMPYEPGESHAHPPRFPRAFSDEAVELLEPMMAGNPRDRPGAPECLLRRWFSLLDGMDADRTISSDSLPVPEREITETDFDEGVGPAPQDLTEADGSPLIKPGNRVQMQPFPGTPLLKKHDRMNPDVDSAPAHDEGPQPDDV